LPPNIGLKLSRYLAQPVQEAGIIRPAVQSLVSGRVGGSFKAPAGGESDGEHQQE
jgi:hypothetical protein